MIECACGNKECETINQEGFSEKDGWTGICCLCCKPRVYCESCKKRFEEK